MCADWIRTASAYLPLDDYRNLFAVMGSRAIHPVQLQHLLFLAHKSRMGAAYKELGAILLYVGIPCRSESSNHLCLMTRIYRGRNIDVAHESYEKLSRISFVYRCGEPPRALPDYRGTFVFEDTRLWRSVSNSYQLVELIYARDNVVEMLSVLLPAEMLDFSPTRTSKIKPDWRKSVA
jgi:hypothetical protein